MNYREELRERLRRVPWSAREIARHCTVSSAYISRCRNGSADSLSLEVAEKIHAALDELGKLARPDEEVSVRHPGVESLASNPALLAECGVTDATLAALRALYLLGPDGRPIIIQTVAVALEWAGLLQRT